MQFSGALQPLPALFVIERARVADVGAHELGMPCVGVLYGYGDRWELEKAGADAIVPSVDALREWLLRG